MAITDAAGMFVEVDPAFCRITGYDAQELASMDFPSMIHPDDRVTREALLAQLASGDIPSFVIEKRLLKKGDGLVWVRDSVSVASDPGEPLRVMVLTEDITDRKQAEEDLRASEERFRIAAEHASDIIYEWDLATGQVTMHGIRPGRFWDRPVPENIEAFKRMVH